MQQSKISYSELENKIVELEAEKQTFQIYKKIVENSPAFILVLGVSGEVVSMNNAMLTSLGYSADEVKGKDYLETFMPEPDKQILISLFAKHREIEEMSVYTNRIIKKDGTTCTVEWRGTPIRNDEKVLIGFAAIGIDITQQMKNESQLRESEEKYRFLLENVGVGIGYYNCEGRVVLFNNLAAQHMGGKPEDFVGKSMEDLFGAADGAVYHSRVTKALESNKTIDYEDEVSIPGGNIWFLSSYLRINDSNGKPMGVQIISKDITERKNYELKLLKTLKDQEIILTHDPAFIIFKDTKNNIIKVTETVANMTGMPREQIEGRPSAEIYPDMADKYYADDLLVMQSRKPRMGIIEPLPSVDGSVKWLQTDKIPYFDENNEVAGIIVFSSDITRIKESEQEMERAKLQAEESEYRLKLAVASGKLGIWDWNVQENTMIWNDRMFELYGISKSNSPNNIDVWIKGLHPEDKQAALAECEMALMGKKPFNTTFRVLRPDGSVLYLKADGVVIPDKEGNPQRMIGINKDITKRKQAEIQLLEAKEKAVESDRLKSAFLANMSHEIRTPMNGILGFADLLKTPDLSGQQQNEYIDIIKKSGKRMLNIINDIVDISKIESGQMRVVIKDTNINTQLEDIHTFFKPEIEEKKINFVLKCGLPKELSVIKTDREKLYAIVTNLVKNALKYTYEGTIELGYSKKDDMLEFYVKDSGIGIAKDRHAAIFERFIQADIENVNAFQGAGLGLSITRSYVEMLGGEIRVESEERQGATFFFTLPCEQNARNGGHTVAPKGNVGPFNTMKKLKVLIAEDDEISGLLLKILLGNICKEILVAKNGKMAVEICKNNPDIDLVLMDIQMPIMNGYDATRFIRTFNPNVVIIAQTAFGLSGDREKALEAGCTDYISKPFINEDFLMLIQKYFK